MKIALLVPDNRDEYRSYGDLEPHFGTAPTGLLEGFEQLDDCEVHVVCCVQKPMRFPEKIGRNIFYHAAVVKKWGWLRGGYLGCVRAVGQMLRGIQPDIVHGQGTERYCALSAVMSGYPNVLTVHGNMRLISKVNGAKPFSFEWLAARLEGFTLPKTDGVVCISTYTRRNVESLARKTWLLPNAAQMTFFDAEPAPVSPPQLLCIGQICLRKNQNAFIRALDGAAGRRKFELHFYGRGDAADAYVAEFFELVKARPWCHYHEFAGRPAIKAALRDASLVVLPTIEDNCPMVVLEAMASGVPVAASRVGGVPDLIDGGVDGILFDVSRPEEMGAAVERVLADESAARALAKAARERARRCFHPKQIALGHMAIYREVLGRIKPGRT